MLDDKNKNDWITAGKIAGEARNFSKTLIEEGALIKDIANKVDKFIADRGALQAFPINISLNEVAAHDSPTINDERTIEAGVYKIDIGVSYNGAIGDCAYSIDISGENQDLINASKKALDAGISTISIGSKIGDIGKAIEDTIMDLGYQPIRNLSGHGVAINTIHCKPSIPNFNNNDPTEIKEGMTFAIEPFATTGRGLISEKGVSKIFSQIGNRPIRNPVTRKIFGEIKKFSTLPFSARNINLDIPESRITHSLNELKQFGNLQDHPPLVEVENGIVSQAEDTILIIDGKVIRSTKVDE